MITNLKNCWLQTSIPANITSCLEVSGGVTYNLNDFIRVHLTNRGKSLHDIRPEASSTKTINRTVPYFSQQIGISGDPCPMAVLIPQRRTNGAGVQVHICHPDYDFLV